MPAAHNSLASTWDRCRAQTTFNIGLTGTGGTVSSNPDLTVSTPLINTGNNNNAGGVLKTGAGIMTLTGASTYTGGTTINGGAIIIQADNNLGASASGGTLNGGMLTTTAGITDTHVFTIGASGGTIKVASTNTSNYQYYFHTANTLLGSGPLTLTGPGTLTPSLGNCALPRPIATAAM